MKKIGVQSLLIHRGSWGNHPDRLIEEKIKGLTVRDIKFYKTRFIHKILKIENPDLIIILTTNYIMDRVVILSARSLGIKTCFLMHGIRSTAQNVIENVKSIPNRSLLKKRWLLGSKYIKKIIPNYFFSGFSDNFLFVFRIASYSILIKIFLKPHEFLLFPPISDELHCDLALVWGVEYRNFFIKQYGYPKERVKVIGHPPLDSLFKFLKSTHLNSDKIKFLNSENIPHLQPYCLLLEAANVEQGVIGWDKDVLIKFISELIDCCKSTGNHLVVKLHPATNVGPIKKYFSKNSNITIVQKIDINKLTFFSSKIIGQSTTTNDLAVVIGKDLLIPAWGISKRISFAAINKQKSAILCMSKEDLVLKLKNNNSDKRLEKIRSDYIKLFITYTDGKSIERSINEITSLIE